MEEKDNTSEEQREEEFNSAKSSIQMLKGKLNEQNQRMAAVRNELRSLREKIRNEDVDAELHQLMSYMEELKSLERRELQFEVDYYVKSSALQAEVADLEEKLATGCDTQSLSDGLNHSLTEAGEKLKSAKKDLAARLRAIVLVKRQLDDFPSQAELVQYDRRSSELNSHIQEKLQQTRKYYATYNALLEIKELMLKETNLLNSISSQFQDAISSTDGRMKLLGSLEEVLKSSQQKLGKVELVLEEEQRVCDALKRRYAAAIAERRHCYTHLKAVQVSSGS